MRRKLTVLCPQEYHGVNMHVVACTRCTVGWDRHANTCAIETGAEDLPCVPADDVPKCPIADRCQHQLQRAEPCVVRARGMICESALAFAGHPEPADHPSGFNSQML